MTDADPLLRYRFTVRQRQVLRLVGAGKKNDAIAAELAISVRTVEAHIASLAERIGYHHLPRKAALKQFWLERQSA